MRHFTSRRTIRTTAVTLGAVVALGAPAAAFAADQPAGADQSVSASVVAKRKLVKTQRLVDGSVGKGYKADITSKGSRVGTINGRGEITYGETGGLGAVHAKMTPNGKVTSWLTSPKPKPGAAPEDRQQDDKRQDDVDPQPQPLPEDAAPAGV
ncbi:hypothetical protein DEJ49_32120 [Streptomyces venezuelae]|uniref:Secreted protein n=2 Tax=Streptomyces venezuelae TaxID=54571 RepID=A0A5P2CQA8_STRVZ|nr:hypothetical protein DEJ49_32120 [Streptomyces venezuelae]